MTLLYPAVCLLGACNEFEDCAGSLDEACWQPSPDCTVYLCELHNDVISDTAHDHYRDENGEPVDDDGNPVDNVWEEADRRLCDALFTASRDDVRPDWEVAEAIEVKRRLHRTLRKAAG